MAAEQYDYSANGDEFADTMNQQSNGDHNGSGGDKINASKNDSDDRKIFVGGLSWETTTKDLKEYFSKFGDVADYTLKTDLGTGRSRGFGFVLFAETGSVSKVLEQKTHTLNGRQIDPKRAMARGGREPILKVFVGGLDPSVPESEIKEYFEKFGKVVEIDLPFDKTRNQRRAFCFVTFETESVVDQVCSQPKQTLSGKRVDVKKATPKEESGWGPGFGGPGFCGGRGGRGGFGRGRGRGGYNSWGDQGYGSGYGSGYDDYYGSQGYGSQGYDYGSGYGSGYDYSSYNQGSWGGGYGSGYNQQGYGNGSYGAGYDYSGEASGYEAGNQGWH